jgi:hypothetical protein
VNIYWAVLVGVLFLVPELIAALDKKPGGTLSEFVWEVFAIDLRIRRYQHLRRFILGAFLAALVFHFLVRSSVVPVIIFGAGIAWCGYYWFRHERGVRWWGRR